MTDPLTEGKQENGEQVAKPVSSNQTQPSQDELTKWQQEIQKALDVNNAMLRALQSGKDKRIAPLENTVAKLAEKLGIDEKQVKDAQKQVALDELADAYLSGDTDPSSDGSGDGKDVSAELQTIKAALDLPTNDKRVTDLELKYGNDLAKFAVEAGKLKISLATAQPTPAEHPLPEGGGNAPPLTDAQKLARMRGQDENPFDIAVVKKYGGGVSVH